MRGDLIRLWLENRPLKLLSESLQEIHKRNVEYQLRLSGVNKVDMGDARYVV